MFLSDINVLDTSHSQCGCSVFSQESIAVDSVASVLRSGKVKDYQFADEKETKIGSINLDQPKVVN